jgi:hypothetical protein
MTPFRNDLHDLRLKCKLVFPSLGRRCWGWVYKNQYQNEYQIAYPCGYSTCLIMLKNVSFSPNLFTTACQFYVMFLVTFKRERHPVWTNWPTCLHLHAKNTTKTCKKWNESKTTQQSYLDYEWGFPRVQSNYSKLISRRRKRPVTATSTQLHWPQERLELELWIWMYDWILLLISCSDSWMSG